MNLTKIIEAAVFAERIKKLDAEIQAINKTALLVANGDFKCSFSMKIIDKKKLEERLERPVEIECIGPLPNTGSFDFSRLQKAMASFSNTLSAVNDPAINTSFDQSINENECLQFLGVLLGIKQQERTSLVKQLTETGFIQ